MNVSRSAVRQGRAPYVSILIKHRHLLLFTVLAVATVACGSPRQIELSASHKLTAGDGKEGDHFGISIWVDGERAIVGATGADDRGYQAGAAYVFLRGEDGWRQEGKLLAGDGGTAEQFGTSVHLDGDRAVVGTRGDVEGGKQSGGAYVYSRLDAGWMEVQKLFASGRSRNDHFGSSVWLDGDVAMVGAQGDNQLGSMAGAAYVYRHTGIRWELDARLTAPDAAPFDYFGTAVCVQGERVVVGARGDDDEGKDSGSVYVFRVTETGWVLDQKLSPFDGCRDGAFGASISMSGSRMLVGAYGDDDSGKRSGSVYIYAWDGKRWRFEQKLTAPDGRATDQFGRSVCLDGARAIVGAHGDQIDSSRKAGSAYLFKRGNAGWVLTAKLVPDPARTLAQFGRSVSMDGSVVAVGSHGDGGRGRWGAGARGAAYLVTSD